MSGYLCRFPAHLFASALHQNYHPCTNRSGAHLATANTAKASRLTHSHRAELSYYPMMS